MLLNTLLPLRKMNGCKTFLDEMRGSVVDFGNDNSTDGLRPHVHKMDIATHAAVEASSANRNPLPTNPPKLRMDPKCPRATSRPASSSECPGPAASICGKPIATRRQVTVNCAKVPALRRTVTARCRPATADGWTPTAISGEATATSAEATATSASATTDGWTPNCNFGRGNCNFGERNCRWLDSQLQLRETQLQPRERQLRPFLPPRGPFSAFFPEIPPFCPSSPVTHHPLLIYKEKTNANPCQI